MKNLIPIACAFAALSLAPSLVRADDQGKRYYDTRHKDYHDWNDNENRTYHQYLKDNHKKDHDWNKASSREQQNYWKWRHDHHDAH